MDAYPLDFPLDGHLLPSGNYLLAGLLFNYLTDNPEIMGDYSPRTPIDIRNPDVIKRGLQLNHKLPKEMIEFSMHNTLANSLYAQGIELAESGQRQQAKPLFLQYLQMNSKEFRNQALYQLGMIDMEERNYSEAINLLSLASDNESSVDRIAYLDALISAYVANGESTKAIERIAYLSEVCKFSTSIANTTCQLIRGADRCASVSLVFKTFLAWKLNGDYAIV